MSLSSKCDNLWKLKLLKGPDSHPPVPVLNALLGATQTIYATMSGFAVVRDFVHAYCNTLCPKTS